MDWKEIEFVLESTDQEADRPFADGWETIRFKIEDEDEQPEARRHPESP